MIAVTTKERMLSLISLLITNINDELNNQPLIEDIPDDIWTADQVERAYFANQALLDSVRYRNNTLRAIAAEARAKMEATDEE